MVFSSERLDFPRGMTISQLLLSHRLNDDASTKPALIDGVTGETTYTFGSFRLAVKRMANYFQSDIGLRRGAVVGILQHNSVGLSRRTSPSVANLRIRSIFQCLYTEYWRLGVWCLLSILFTARRYVWSTSRRHVALNEVLGNLPLFDCCQA